MYMDIGDFESSFRHHNVIQDIFDIAPYDIMSFLCIYYINLSKIQTPASAAHVIKRRLWISFRRRTDIYVFSIPGTNHRHFLGAPNVVTHQYHTKTNIWLVVQLSSLLVHQVEHYWHIQLDLAV